jgi:septal ring factor EnvC (AmiA/AmiB activator)
MRRIFAFSAMLLAGSFATAQEGVNQTESLIKKGEQTVKAVSEARLQLEKTLANYNTIVDGKAADPKASYKDLGKAVKDTEDRVAAVSKRKDEMDAEAGTLFASWKASTDAISNPDLKKKSQDRLDATQARYGKIATAGKDARGEYDAFLTGLKDQITFLGHDLNPAAMTSLKPEAAKLNDKAKAMFVKIDAAAAAANASIDGMRQK